MKNFTKEISELLERATEEQVNLIIKIIQKALEQKSYSNKEITEKDIYTSLSLKGGLV